MVLISEQIRESAHQVCEHLAALEDPGADSSNSMTALVARFDDVELQLLLADAAALRSETDALIAAGAGVIAKRSEWELGYSGLAQRRGHRTPTALVQSLTGSSRSEAARQVRLGEAMGEADAAVQLLEAGRLGESSALNALNQAEGGSDLGSTEVGSTEVGSTEIAGSSVLELPWFEPLTRAVAEHRVTPEGASAMMRGLGEPNERCAVGALRAAAEELLAKAAGAHVDELAKRARWLRDQLDPAGVAIRAQEHYDQRTWRFSRNATGARTAWVQFDDESAAWIDAIVGAGMRPRRGGPRFVDKGEAERAQRLMEDPRTNDQLVFDLLMDAIRAGSQADPSIAFGSRQPGVRVIINEKELGKRDDNGAATGTGYWEEAGESVPGTMVDRLLCDAGIRSITVDENGSPLNVGREQRLFTTKQRIALAYRDGGCMIDGCDRPPSYTEAHHIDNWVADHGRTDIADGVLLCRFDHMRIHNNGWKIRREDSAYWLIPLPGVDPGQTPIPMRSKSRRSYALSPDALTG